MQSRIPLGPGKFHVVVLVFHVFCGKKRTREPELDRASLALGSSTTVPGNEKRRDLRKANLEDDIPPTVKQF